MTTQEETRALTPAAQQLARSIMACDEGVYSPAVRDLAAFALAARGMREALEDMKYAMDKLNGAVDAMWNDPAGRSVSALHQADITHAQQVIKKTLDDHASTLSPNRPLAGEEK